MNLGNIGNPDTLVWLFCDLQTYGKILIRRGHRNGLPKNKPPIWTFCPLIKDKFPRDRVLIEDCKECSHYKGVSHSLKRLKNQSKDIKKSYIIKSRKRPKISEKDINGAIKEKEKRDEEWLKEERRIFGNK